jgi:hypothetical protein
MAVRPVGKPSAKVHCPRLVYVWYTPCIRWCVVPATNFHPMSV